MFSSVQARAPGAALSGHHALSRTDDIADEFVLGILVLGYAPQLRAERDRDDDVVAVRPVPAGARSRLPRPGLVVHLVGEGLQVAELSIAHEDDVTATAAIAPVGAAPRNVHLVAKRNAAVPAVPGRHVDLCLIEEHGRLREGEPGREKVRTATL